MELSSPVGSLVPSLVLNAVVTPRSSRLEFWAIPIRRVPVLRDSGRRLWAEGDDDGEEAQEGYQGQQRDVAGDAAGCSGDRHWGHRDLRGRSRGSRGGECTLLSDFHSRPLCLGGLVEAVWGEDGSDGIHGRLLDPTVPDSGGPRHRGLLGQR